MARGAHHLGLYGLARQHMAIQIARGQTKVYAFTVQTTAKARLMPGRWVPNGPGHSGQPPPHLLDASLIFAPVGALVPLALAVTVKEAA